MLSLESFPRKFLKKRENRESPLGESAGLSCDRGSVIWYGCDIFGRMVRFQASFIGHFPFYIFCLGLFHKRMKGSVTGNLGERVTRR